MAAKPQRRNEEAVLRMLCLIVTVSGRPPSPKLLGEGIVGGCETERRSEVGKLRLVDKTKTKRSAPKKPRTLALLASPYIPRTT